VERERQHERIAAAATVRRRAPPRSSIPTRGSFSAAANSSTSAGRIRSGAASTSRLGELRDDRVRVVATSVEEAVDGALEPQPQRREQDCDDARRHERDA
jgi:hypothetical protein